MRRNGIVLTVLMIMWLAIPGFAGEKYLVFFTGNYLLPADGSYKNIYGSGVLYPELIIGSEVRKNLSLWFGFGLLSAKGTMLDTEEEAKCSQNFLSVGTRYSGKISENMVYKVDLGLFIVVYNQDNLEEELSGSALGFRTDFGIVYTLNSRLFTEFSIGCLSASDRVRENSVKWGGFKGGVGLGIWF